jgi:hypothetical protein
MLFDRYIGPFLMDDIGKDGKFFGFFDLMLLPIVGELIARLLSHHALRPCLAQVSLALSSDLSGSVISWIRSYPTFASKAISVLLLG